MYDDDEWRRRSARQADVAFVINSCVKGGDGHDDGIHKYK